MSGLVDAEPLCACGYRRGLHRYADEACPDPQWKPGNGRRCWLTRTYRPAPTDETEDRAVAPRTGPHN